MPQRLSWPLNRMLRKHQNKLYTTPECSFVASLARLGLRNCFCFNSDGSSSDGSSSLISQPLQSHCQQLHQLENQTKRRLDQGRTERMHERALKNIKMKFFLKEHQKLDPKQNCELDREQKEEEEEERSRPSNEGANERMIGIGDRLSRASATLSPARFPCRRDF
ncbi:unnamed protein product [Caenorhabditis auriculariae]|uniref:Uncharacterized protein n=1 Tax=Caenorhabditis auriculariae TaxID=2777116 RepID=A0A8S1GWL7_9PELO|nr:unnamed protein product [Caenorhabditis auriculariae]